MNVLVFDVETSGLEPRRDAIIEVGCVLWSVEHRSMLEVYSAILPGTTNAAQPFNGISPELLGAAGTWEIPWAIVDQIAQRADCVAAHSAIFDRRFVENNPRLPAGDRDYLIELPWLCTIEDFEWPVPVARKSLINVALAHGVALTAAHRAVNDCLLLTRLFERIDDVDERLDAALVKARRPKAEFIALTSYDEKEIVKAAGFHWDGSVWHRYLAIEDAEKLPFKTARRQELSP